MNKIILLLALISGQIFVLSAEDKVSEVLGKHAIFNHQEILEPAKLTLSASLYISTLGNKTR